MKMILEKIGALKARVRQSLLPADERNNSPTDGRAEHLWLIALSGVFAVLVCFYPPSLLGNIDYISQDGLIVLAEAWYPGGKAEVYDRAASVLPANAWTRAVPTSAGQH